MKDIVEKSLVVAYRGALPVRIVYDGKDGLTERTIIIKNIKEESLVAYCRLRRRISTFKLDNILAAEVQYKEKS